MALLQDNVLKTKILVKCPKCKNKFFTRKSSTQCGAKNCGARFNAKEQSVV